ncbi:hypothetical protein ACFL2D_00685 [Patescibacteria group bacterium]
MPQYRFEIIIAKLDRAKVSEEEEREIQEIFKARFPGLIEGHAYIASRTFTPSFIAGIFFEAECAEDAKNDVCDQVNKCMKEEERLRGWYSSGRRMRSR